VRALNYSLVFCATVVLAACSHSTKLSEQELDHQLHHAESAVAESELLCDLMRHKKLPDTVAHESALALEEQIEDELKQLNEKVPDSSQQEVVSRVRSVFERLSQYLTLLAMQSGDPDVVQQLSTKIQACRTLLPGAAQ
jgi:hypothetical protein